MRTLFRSRKGNADAKKGRGFRPTLEHLEHRCLMATGFLQLNLASDLPGLADMTNANLVNPWGISSSPTGPFWLADQGTGLSNVLNGQAESIPLLATIPAAQDGQLGSPTGTVYNGTSGFIISANGVSLPGIFLFASEDGTISGWNGFVDSTQAVVTVNNSAAGASYMGLAIAQDRAGQTLLYAADFGRGQIDVFNSDFQLVSSTSAFQDANLPAGYVPFNVQTIGNEIVVTYAQKTATGHDEAFGSGLGVVDIYTTSGDLVSRLASGGSLNAPWGVALAPSSFGPFGGDLLIGNRGDGRISAFDPSTGTFRGQLADNHSTPISLNELWGLTFGNDHLGGDADTLFFAAGVDNETHGLFGAIQAPGQQGIDTAGFGGYDPDFPGEVQDYPVPPASGPRLLTVSTNSTTSLAGLQPMSEASLALLPTLTFASLPNTASLSNFASRSVSMTGNGAGAIHPAVYFVSAATPLAQTADFSLPLIRSDRAPMELNAFLNLDAASRSVATAGRQASVPLSPAGLAEGSESPVSFGEDASCQELVGADTIQSSHEFVSWSSLCRSFVVMAMIPLASSYLQLRGKESALPDESEREKVITVIVPRKQ